MKSRSSHVLAYEKALWGSRSFQIAANLGNFECSLAEEIPETRTCLITKLIPL